ncbi:MAG: hypothetical protein LBQ15_10955 [Clostridium sp.]|jgi:hypothetical protein|nr:hypothetical protein [Clostridium sp.]
MLRLFPVSGRILLSRQRIQKLLRGICAVFLALALSGAEAAAASPPAEPVSGGILVLDPAAAAIVTQDAEWTTYYAVVPFSATYFTNCNVSLAKHVQGGFVVKAITQTVGTASVVGTKNLVIERSYWYGWATVATDSAGSYTTNATSYTADYWYLPAVDGATYRASVTHYTHIYGYTEELPQTTASYVYNA